MKLQCSLKRWDSNSYALWKASIFPHVAGLRTFAVICSIPQLDEKTRTFSILPSQWEIHPDPEWRQRWINDAQKWQDQIPEAKEFLKKVGANIKNLRVNEDVG